MSKVMQKFQMKITPAADGRRYSKYPDGNTPADDPPSWNLPATISIPAGSSVGVRQYTADATGWTIAVTGLEAISAGLSYDSGTETIVAAVGGTAGTGTATFTLSKTGETDVVDTATAALTASAVDTSARVWHTNYGPGVTLNNSGSWNGGTYYWLAGTDASTGFSHEHLSPSLYGASNIYVGGRGAALQMLASGLAAGQANFPSGPTTDVSNSKWDFRLEQVVGPFGNNQHACYIRRKQAYQDPDQMSWQFFPDVDNVTQGMVYIRFWVRYAPGFFDALTSGGTWFGNMLNETKAHEPQWRFSLQATPSRALNVFVDAQASENSSDTFFGNTITSFQRFFEETVAGVFSNTGGWHKVEIAYRGKNASSAWQGFLWCAVDGVQRYSYIGQTTPDIRTTQIRQVFTGPFYYANGTQANDTRMGVWYTGHEVWTDWPSDATAHPGIGT